MCPVMTRPSGRTPVRTLPSHALRAGLGIGQQPENGGDDDGCNSCVHVPVRIRELGVCGDELRNAYSRPALVWRTNGKGEEGTHEKIFSHVGRSGVVDFERNRFGTEPDAAEQRQLRCRNVWSENNASG